MAGLSDTLSRFDVSGEILNEDVIGLLTQPDPKVPGCEMNLGDCAAAFELLSEVWQEIRLEVAEFDTSKLREKWLMPLFELLGHELTYLRGHTEFAHKKTIPLTHQSAVKVPVWMLDFGQTPDEKPSEGRSRRSPHELFQEYLDMTPDSWGIISNGQTLRLLHDYHKSLTRNFVEVDLEAVFESLDFDAFRALWRIFHANAFKPGAKGVLPIEKLRDFSRQEGTEIGKELRFQVLEAIKVLGNGFLEADVSGNLTTALKEDPVALMTFYRSLLRIVYRLLFLLYVDNKPNWTPAQDRVWSSSYSITRMRREAEDAAAEDGKIYFARAHSEDHWEGLKVVFKIIREGTTAFNTKIHPYGGDLFAEESLWKLKDAPLHNQDLLKVIRLLTIFERRSRGRNRQIYRVNFRNLRIDALGSVYEALLDIAPVLKENGRFDFGDGAERKLSGTYYTPPALVAEIVKAALIPVIDDRLAGVNESDQEAALLNIKVVDPACGSGAFLIQAMDALAGRLCEIRYQGESPTDEQLRAARRDVVTKCIHGVDLNPMAIELCKFTLWLHVAHPELPLSYLEPVIVCGNALVGIPLKAQVEREKKRLAEAREDVKKRTDLSQKQKQSALKKLEYVGWPDSIPDEAFNLVTGDIPGVASQLKRQNKTEREGQPGLPFQREETHRELRAKKYLSFKLQSEDNIEAQRQKRELYERWRNDEDIKRQLFEADFWCSAFFWRGQPDSEAPTDYRFREIKEENLNTKPVSYWGDSLTQRVRALASLPEPGDPISTGLGFFHWEIEFPDVDAQGGFDCILGNPPWERIKLQEQEFFEPLVEHQVFGEHARAISEAKNKGGRERVIRQLHTDCPELLSAFENAKHAAECSAKFVRESGCYPLTAVGDVNTYAIFAERSRCLSRVGGRASIIVPTGIATDDTTKRFFGDLVQSDSLYSIIGFENEGNIFVGVHHAFKFAILTMGEGAKSAPAFAFLCRKIDHSHDPTRIFCLTKDDFNLLNPNTRTCPVFRTNADAELTKLIYRRVPVLVNESTKENPWGISFMRMFDMSNDSGEWFEDPEDLDELGYRLSGNVYVHDGRKVLPATNPKNGVPHDNVYLPLFEAKMVHHFDHRFGTYEGATQAHLNEGTLPNPGEQWKQNLNNVAMPRYWVSKQEVLLRSSRVPPGIKQAIRSRDEQMAIFVLTEWLVGWIMNRGQAGDVTEAHTIAFDQLTSKSGSPMRQANTAFITAMQAQHTEKEFPLTDEDREVLQNSKSALEACQRLLELHGHSWLLGFRDVASTVTERTGIFTLMPFVGAGHTLPFMFPEVDAFESGAICASMSSLVFDFCARQKLGSNHMTFFTLKQLPVLTQVAINSNRDELKNILLELNYTADDMRPWAEAMGYKGEPFTWNDDRRAILKAELDACFAKLYGLNRKQLRYILDPHGLSDAELEDITSDWEDPTCSGPHLLPENPTTTFPGETFRVLKVKEIAKYGEYRTRRLVLEAWDNLQRGELK
jgi:hypothetical protein